MEEKNLEERLKKIKNVYEDYIEDILGPLSTPAMEDHYKKILYLIGKLDLPEKPVIHDAGCGPAYFTRRIFEALDKTPIIIATDWVEGMIKRGEEKWGKKKYYKDCEKRGQIQLKCMDLTKDWLWSEEKFDLQIFSLVLCYLPSLSRKEILEKTFKTTKPNGYAIFSIFLKGFSVEKASKKFKVLQGLGIIFSPKIRLLKKLLRGAKTTERLDGPMPPEEYPDKQEFINYLKNLGFIDVKAESDFLEGWGIVVSARKPLS